ncbi:hypothetical protein CFH99_20940 [Nocardioides aromaticivorans]|uniref:Cardiolipin synthase N-terminal domain-containing protein n=1 Tax=Nocardioides aromaticivorans TaxID=200618 RepID=A0ABX7PR53_9ACTN|nr:hypothetical protein CFH99_20940 [Nocardioides aromaticivorans]
MRLVIASSLTLLVPVAAEERGDRSGEAFGLAVVLGGLLIGLAVVGLFVLWLAVLVQALRIPDSTWEAADQSKLVYVLLMVLLGLLGTLLYWLVARPALRRAGASAPAQA